MIQIRNVTKKYGKLVANDNLNFDAADGRITVLLGPNGAGKSTIIKSIAGLLRFKGEILIDGLSNKSVEAKAKIGYIPEMPAIYDMLTVREHLEFIARAYRLKDWQGRADSLLERLELDDKAKKLGRELSKGMQQKVSIACALIHEPSVTIFDEPLVGLDPHAIKELRVIFEELKNRGCSVLISTHMLDSVSGTWDTAHIMMNGKFAATRLRGEEDAGGKSLEDLFFEITEGTPAPSGEEAPEQ